MVGCDIVGWGGCGNGFGTRLPVIRVFSIVLMALMALSVWTLIPLIQFIPLGVLLMALSVWMLIPLHHFISLGVQLMALSVWMLIPLIDFIPLRRLFVTLPVAVLAVRWLFQVSPSKADIWASAKVPRRQFLG